MNLFVYYKFLVDQSPDVYSLVKDIQRQLVAEFPQLICDLLKRPNPDESGRETWMEVYTLDDKMLPEFQSRLNQLALEIGLPQPRLNELFVPIAQ